MVIYTVKGFGIVNKAEIDIFLELSCFFDDPADVGNLISVATSSFSKQFLSKIDHQECRVSLTVSIQCPFVHIQLFTEIYQPMSALC